MQLSEPVRKILSHYEGDNPGTKANLARILMQDKLGGTGKLVILPVDQGFEHGPARSFAPNPPAYDPHYHFQLALDAGLSAYAAPLGFIEAGAASFAGAIPTILKVNSANSLARAKEAPSQAVTASVKDALRLGCAAIGFTIYPGSDAAYDMMEEIAEILGISSTDVASIVGFYTLYYDKPGGKFRIQVCTDLPCALRGAEDFLEKLCENLAIRVGETTPDGLVTVEHVMCLAGCDKAPMFQLQSGDGLSYHENQTVETALELVEELKQQAGRRNGHE